MARSENGGRRLALLVVLLGAVALFAAVSIIADNKVVIQNEAAVDTTTSYVTLRPGQCAILGVDLVIDANAPYYKTLAAYQINIEKVPQ